MRPGRCAVSDTAVPNVMGAALTYARRYGLFTLVGIAGDDDLDAPDLAKVPPNAASLAIAGLDGAAPANGAVTGREPGPLPPSAQRSGTPSSQPTLAPAESARLRAQLEGEIAALVNEEEVLRWAHRSLSAKNTLTAEDAHSVEEAFEAELRGLEPPAQIGCQTKLRQRSRRPPLRLPNQPWRSMEGARGPAER